jgi:RND family efflux transporter MFP subunit
MPDASFDPASVPTVRRADAQARNARERLDRARQLHTRTPPLISDQDFADIQTQFDVARNDFEVARLAAAATLAEARTRAAEIDLARQLLADAVVRAPSDQSGRTWSVARRSVSLGELVQPGSAMFTLVVDQPIRLRAAVPERAAAKVQTGQLVRLEVEGASTQAEGVIRRISPAIDPTTRTLAVEAVFANADRSLRPGAFARGRIVVGEQTGLVQVPESAIFSFAGIRRVFVIDQDKVRARQVEIIRIDGDRAFVRGEVEPGAKVAITQLGKLSDGATVRVATAAPSAAATN